ncbi:hypothetical protein FTX61_07935 [Nitriliruptoraceae bacterium ZYF776]|nr:hypothetical protein [Profundirhabdus halotolerans]
MAAADARALRWPRRGGGDDRRGRAHLAVRRTAAPGAGPATAVPGRGAESDTMTGEQVLRRYGLDLAVGLPVVAAGVLELWARSEGAPPLLVWVVGRDVVEPPWLPAGGDASVVVLTLAIALACVTARRHGAVALGVLWAMGAWQLASGADVVAAQLAVVYVAFALACWGSRTVVWTSLASLPVAAALVGAHVLERVDGRRPIGAEGWSILLQELALVVPLVALALLTPWLVGFVTRTVRTVREARRAQAEAERTAARSDELATLRADQARLARDVHDVVGHSLTVILAQAEAARYHGDDVGRIQEALANIATTSRRSLDDVRQVLQTTSDRGGSEATPATSDLGELVDGVRAAGHDVVATVDGTPRPLPPEIHVVAYRALQELLTNALKHGRRAGTVRVAQRWDHEQLRLTVDNPVGLRPDASSAPGPSAPGPSAPGPSAAGATDGPGLGLAGMARRLESIGGSMRVQDGRDDGGDRFVVEVRLPLRPVARS